MPEPQPQCEMAVQELGTAQRRGACGFRGRPTPFAEREYRASRDAGFGSSLWIAEEQLPFPSSCRHSAFLFEAVGVGSEPGLVQLAMVSIALNR
jgi:hypothetical protein